MQEMRRRYKAFAHLPLSCEYTLVELDMAQLVSPATMQEFASKQTCMRGRANERTNERMNRTRGRGRATREIYEACPVYRSNPVSALFRLPFFMRRRAGVSASTTAQQGATGAAAAADHGSIAPVWGAVGRRRQRERGRCQPPAAAGGRVGPAAARRAVGRARSSISADARPNAAVVRACGAARSGAVVVFGWCVSAATPYRARGGTVACTGLVARCGWPRPCSHVRARSDRHRQCRKLGRQWAKGPAQNRPHVHRVPPAVLGAHL